MRIPTYTFRKTDLGLEVNGAGASGNIFPNLVFIRDKSYRFWFFNLDSIIEFYDKDGKVLLSVDENNFPSVIFRFGKNYPSEIYYRTKNSIHKNEYGKILIRDFNRIYGKVISYGYSKNSKFGYDLNNLNNVTNSDGIFELNLNELVQSENDTYHVVFDLFSQGGFDTAVLNVNSETYSDELPFSFKANTGCLHLSALSSVFYYIRKQFVKSNYREIESLIQKYFGFSQDFDPITDDPIYSYITNRINLSDFTNFILFTTIVELNFVLCRSEFIERSDDIFAKIANEILNGTKKISFDKFRHLLPDIESSENIKLFNIFENLFAVLSERIKQQSDDSTKKVCVLETIYDLIYKFRNSVYKSQFVSKELFLTNDFHVTPNTIKIPSESRYVLLSSIEGCSVAPFGKYARIKITEDVLYSVFNQVLPIEPEVILNLLNKIIYIRYGNESNNDYFCYKVIDFIDYDYDLYKVGEVNENEESLNSVLIQGFDDESVCCQLESVVKLTENERNISKLEITEQELFDLRMYDINKNLTLSLNIKNTNYPFSYEISETTIQSYYIDEYLVTKNIPAYIFIPKKYSTTIQSDTGINLIFDSEYKNYVPNYVRYDFETIKIVNVLYENETLKITTDTHHGYKFGDSILIKNSSKDGHINGRHKIIGTSGEFGLTLDYELPSGVDANEINGTFAETESLDTTKLYINGIEDFSIGDSVYAENTNMGKSYKVITIKKDYLGSYLVLDGILPLQTNIITKKRNENIPNKIQYSLNKNPKLLKLDTIDLDLNLYDVFIPSKPGEFSRNLSRLILSSVMFKMAKIAQNTDGEVVDIGDVNEILDLNEDNDFDLFELSTKEHDSEYKTDELAYHFSRNYLRDNYLLEGYEEVSEENDTYDWNGDGIVGRDELLILERFILTSPKTIEEYNANREQYPEATTLPNIVTAQYACQEYCCHDDFNESGQFSEDNTKIYEAFQVYIEKIGHATPTDYFNFISYYNTLVTQGLQPELSTPILYMPTTPNEHKYCGDYTDSGKITNEDALIYYAHQLYYENHSSTLPESVEVFKNYYNQLVQNGIVPALNNNAFRLPSLASEDTITTTNGEFNKGCELIESKDLAIYDEWILQGKPTDIDEFNSNRSNGVPRACFLPVDDGYGGGQYDEFGGGFAPGFAYDDDKLDIYSGIENL